MRFMVCHASEISTVPSEISTVPRLYWFKFSNSYGFQCSFVAVIPIPRAARSLRFSPSEVYKTEVYKTENGR